MVTIAVDFETANETRGSPCSIGLAWIENGCVVRTEHRLIRPRDMRFAPINVGIHGINPSLVESSPEFPDVIAEFEDQIEGSVVLSHNAAFDMSVWRAVSDSYRISYPRFTYLCTLKMSQSHWSHLASHRLNVVSRHAGVTLKHHDAASDASACAHVAIQIGKELGVRDISEIPPLIGMQPGEMAPGSYAACSCPIHRAKEASFVPKERRLRVIPDGPLSGLSIVFTGALETMTRDEAENLANSLGATTGRSVSRRTNLVVAGPGAGSKLERAIKLGVSIIDEDQWFGLVSRT